MITDVPICPVGWVTSCLFVEWVAPALGLGLTLMSQRWLGV